MGLRCGLAQWACGETRPACKPIRRYQIQIQYDQYPTDIRYPLVFMDISEVLFEEISEPPSIEAAALLRLVTVSASSIVEYGICLYNLIIWIVV